MKNCIILFGIIAVASASYAQQEVEYMGRDFHDLKSTLITYFEDLENSGNIEAFEEGREFSRFKKWEAFWSYRLGVGHTFEGYEKSLALSHTSLQQRNSSLNTGDWIEIGPTDLPYGTARVGQGSGYGIGPIRFINISEDNEDYMLCGSHLGGVYYTSDAGETWSNGGSDKWTRSGCYYASFKSDDHQVWFGSNYRFTGWTGGLWRTSNFGVNWDLIGDQSSFGGIWTEVFKTISDKADPDILYVATSNNIYRTTNVMDQNPIWAPVATIPVPTSILNDPDFGSYNYSSYRYVFDLVAHPTNANRLYAAVRYDGELSQTEKVRYWRIMYTNDGGISWTEIPSAPSHTFWQTSETVDINGSPVLVTTHQNAKGMGLETTMAESGVLYAQYDLEIDYQDEIWKISDPNQGLWNSVSTNQQVTYGWCNGFEVSQTVQNDLYVGWHDRYKTFINGSWNSFSSGSSNYLDYHVDIEDFASHPLNPGEVWMADHGGIRKSIDYGANWEWKGVGLGVAEVYRMSTSYSEPDYVALGLFHDANIISDGTYQSSNWDPDWRQMGGADGHVPLIDPINGANVYISSQNNCWRKSADHGFSCSTLPPSLSPCFGNDSDCPRITPGSGDWHTEGTLDPEQPNILYISVWVYGPSNPEEIRRSVDQGDSFETISDFQSLIGNGVGANIWRIYPSTLESENLYVHFSSSDSGQRLFRTTNARGNAANVTNSWEELPLPRTDDVFVADIDFDLEDPNILYISYSSSSVNMQTSIGTEMLFRSDYSDINNPLFTPLTGITNNALPNTGVGAQAFTLERGSNGGMYMATDIGVFYTNNELMDNGQEWTPFGLHLPRVECKGLEINYKVNKIRTGLNGRGLWEHDLFCPSEDDKTESGTYQIDEFLEANNIISSVATVPIGLEITYRAGAEVLLSSGFHAQAGSDFHGFIHPCSEPGNSFKSGVENDNSGKPGNESVSKLSNDNWNIYPNPIEYTFNVSAKFKWMTIDRIELHDLSGRVVPINSKIDGNYASVEVAKDLRSGMYLVLIYDSEGLAERKKIIIQN